MDVPVLIELIQGLVPDALSDAQIDEIRAGLAGDDNLREALAAELSAQADAEGEVAPALASFDDVMARIEALAAGLRTKRRRAWAIRGASALALTGVVVWAVCLAWPGPEETPDSVADSASNRGGPARPATRPTTGPTSRSAASSTRPGTTRPTTGPAQPDGTEAPSRMTWQEFILPDYRRKTGEWREELSKLFLRLSGKDPGSSRDRRYIEFDGTYRLGSVPTHGRLLRMGFWDGKQFDLDLWSGNEGVRLHMAPDGSRIEAKILARKDPRSLPMVTGSHTDRGAWRWYGRGAIDLRYQDNRILVCRGEVPLFTVPIPGPPTEGSVKAARVRMWMAEVRPCRKLALPPKRPDRTTTTRTSAGKLTWTKQLQRDTQLTIEQGKVVALSGEGKHTTARAWFELDLPPLAALEATIHVSQCTPMAGIFAQMGSTQRPIFAYKRGRDRVIGTGDRRKIDEDIRAGRTVGEEFWIRIRFGLDAMMVWISPDGKRWWLRQHYPSYYGRTGRVQIGLELQRGPDRRRIAVDDITIRRFDAIARMAGVSAPAEAAAISTLTNEVINASRRAEALADMEEARPEQVDPVQWLTACDAVLACRSRHWQVRGAALREVFLTPCYRGADTDVQGVLAALEELLETAVMQRGELSKLAQDVFTGLGRSCIEAGNREATKAVMDASYLRPGSVGLPGVDNINVVPAGLLRLYLLDLMARGEWKTVRLEAARAMYIGRTRHQHNPNPLAKWALDQAQSRLGDQDNDNGPKPASIWRHPMAVSDDPEMMNIMGEFLFLVRKKHYEAACKMLTSRTLPDSLVATEGYQEILQTSHFKVRQIIRATPQLGLVLRQARYRQIGMIRLERARRQNDLETLRSLAVQFYRTEPGLGALHVLADRDLSNGDFSRAAARYRLLQESNHYSHRDDAAVKFRMAWAMMGKLAGKPATRTVKLPGGTFSPEEFERMIEQLATARNRPDVALAAAAPSPGPGPGGAKGQLTHLADTPGKAVTLRYPQARPGDLVLDGDRVLVSHVGKLFAVDWRARKIAWSFETSLDPRRRSSQAEGRARLLRVGRSLYVRCMLPGRPLACFDTLTGKRLWSRLYGDRVVSDPVLIGSWVSVISARDSVSGSLQLQRVSPITGETSLSSRPVQIRDSLSSIGRPVVVGDSLLFRTPGCLISCDLRGEIQWARRLPLVPAGVLPEAHTTGMSVEDMLVWRDRDVIFCARGCPYVMCVSTESGKVLWSFMISPPARLVGLVAGNAIVVEPDRICALDPETGKIRWQRHYSPNDAAVMPADDGMLVVVKLARPRGGRRDTSTENRYVRWMSATNGRTILEIPVIGDGGIYGVSRLLSDGKRIFGLSNNESNRSSCKVFMIETSR